MIRFIIMHKTNAHWESGAIPSPELIARVGGFLGELSKTGRLHSAAGLRASSEGVRLQFHKGERTVITGPFTGNNELPAGFTILRAHSLNEAIEWATRQATIIGDVEIDIRPVTEPWDIGMQPRPAEVETRRYMILRKATDATESSAAPTPSVQTQLTKLIEATMETGGHVAAETMRPSRRGRRYKNSRNGVSLMDGPFVETKELLAGYIIVLAASLDEVEQWAMKYLDVVGADEVDVRELD